MKKYGFEWPEHMNCDLFPEYGSTKEVCMDPMDQEQQQSKKKLTINHNSNAKAETNVKALNKKTSTSFIYKTNKLFANDEPQFLSSMCPHPFVKIFKETDPRLNKITTGNVLNCAHPCKSAYFNDWQRMFSVHWLFVWSMICLVTSLSTTFTYLIDSSRFKYPERPIIYLSICYMFVSIGYLIRFVVGHEKMACESDGSAKYEINLSLNSNADTLTCHLSFVLIYYFGMASSVWWVIISMTWFLAAGLKWGTEAISKYSGYFHLFAWLLPFIQTMAILAMSLVDSDPLTGICYVGNLSSQNLRLFVLTPAISYLTVGITFLIAGFISLFRIRNMIKQQHGDPNKAQKIEKLMLRIGVFSILYTVPATCVIACQFYEQHYRSDWEKRLLCKRSKMEMLNNQEIDSYCATMSTSEYSESPEFSVFILKYLMSLIVGITSGFWIFSKKTLKTWSTFLSGLVCCCNTNKTKQNDKLDENPNGADSLTSTGSAAENCSLISCLFKCKLAKTTRHRKDSIVYFQANDDLENNPHNILYDSTSSSQTNQQLQQQQILLSNNSASIYQSNLDSNRNLIKANNNAAVTEPFVALNFNSNNINNNIPQYAYQMQNNCHTNKAAAFYYDYSNTSKNTELTSGSSKYSFQSSTLSSVLPK